MNSVLRIAIAASVTISSVVLAGATTRPTPAGSGLRLDGTFIQYQPWMMKLDAQAWHQELDAMRQAGLRTIVLQWLARNDGSFMPSEPGAADPTEIILGYADRHDMEVYLGLFMDDDWWKWGQAAKLPERLINRTRETAEQAWARYGKHTSFAGWYIPPEPADSLAPASVAELKSFLASTSRLCKELSGDKPVTFAPFLTGQVEPAAVEKNYAELLTGSGIDIVMLQDGVGARSWDDVVHSRVAPLFRAMRNACLVAGVELWSDLEIFHNTSGDPAKPQFVPSNTGRLGFQLAAEAPFVSRFIAFDFFHYMSPHRGPKQREFHQAYLREFVDKPFYPVFGPSVIIDPTFAYYLERSPESIAAEIRANGYSTVHYIAEPSSRVNPKLMQALHDAGIGAWCQIFGNGTYSIGHYPPQWREWRMVTRAQLTGENLPVPGFERLCMNNADYRAWKKKDLAEAVRIGGFDGVEIGEAFWPEYPGRESASYACFCKACLQAFTRMFPEESALPDVVNAESPRHPKRNQELWKMWLQFRQVTMTGFADDLVNGPGGLRESSPGAAVSIWGLALSAPDSVQRLREDHGQDAGLTAAKVKPDVYCFQTHWPDWSRANLPPDYVKTYMPFIAQLRDHAPHVPLMIQADIGSTREAVHDRPWVEAFERNCQDMGAQSTCLYEYFIGGWTYHEPARASSVTRKQDRIQISFTRRLDPASARRDGAFELNGRSAAVLEVDGNLVTITAPRTGPGPDKLQISGLMVDRSRLLFKDTAVADPVRQILFVR